MAIDEGHYEGRPQALVKHTFLHQYLPALANKVCSTWDCFTYVDGFAGPWQAADETSFADTSFGIALKSMSDAQKFQSDTRARKIRMVAHLVERDNEAFEKLQRLAERFPTIEVRTYSGDFHSHLPTILSSLRTDGFCFSFIDPKGFSLDLSLLKPLLARPSSEVLVNFMFDFVNRFVSHPNPAIVDVIGRLIPGADWQQALDLSRAAGATPKAREEILVDAFRTAIRSTGNFHYVTSLVVQKPLVDRTLYHLVFGTRSRQGLSVFRDSQVRALEAQAKVRVGEKTKTRTAATGQGDLFGGADAVPHDPSAQEITQGEAGAVALACELLKSRSQGIRWVELWPLVLQSFTVRENVLARRMFDLAKQGRVLVTDWPLDRFRTPEDQLLFQRVEEVV